MFSLAWLIAVEGSLLLTYVFVCLFQRRCRERVVWHEHHAGVGSSEAAQLRHLAEFYTGLAQTAAGERARDFYLRQAGKTAREADRLGARTSWHQARARLWQWLG